MCKIFRYVNLERFLYMVVEHIFAFMRHLKKYLVLSEKKNKFSFDPEHFLRCDVLDIPTV
jgi:hypothetical protein